MMDEIDHHLKKEYRKWEQIQQRELANLNASLRHLWLNILAYTLIAVVEYILARLGHSQTLMADAWNNISGIISTGLLMTGIHIARDMDDNDIAGIPLPNLSLKKTGNDQRIQFTRLRYETVFTLVTSIVMIGIALKIIVSGGLNLMDIHRHFVPKAIAFWGAVIASVIMLGVWYLNRKAGRKLKNAALIASSKDSLGDALTSIGTAISILGAQLFYLTWLDGAASIVVGLFILYAGGNIFIESSLNLVDYFDPKTEAEFRREISQLPEVHAIEELKAHYNGNLVTLDVVVVVAADMSVLDSYRLGEYIERMMGRKFGIIDTDVSFIPDTQENIKKGTRRGKKRKKRKY